MRLEPVTDDPRQMIQSETTFPSFIHYSFSTARWLDIEESSQLGLTYLLPSFHSIRYPEERKIISVDNDSPPQNVDALAQSLASLNIPAANRPRGRVDINTNSSSLAHSAHLWVHRQLIRLLHQGKHSIALFLYWPSRLLCAKDHDGYHLITLPSRRARR